jgi:hypothetical protein
MLRKIPVLEAELKDSGTGLATAKSPKMRREHGLRTAD